MVVLLVGRFGNFENLESHIKDSFEELGHQVIPFDIWGGELRSKNKILVYINKANQHIKSIKKSLPYYDKKKTKELQNICKSHPFDLIVSCHDFLTPTQVSGIKKICKIPIVLWFPDALLNFGKMMFANAEYDVLFFKDPSIVKVLRDELGLNAYYLPECCNPKHHRKVHLNEEDWKTYGCDIATAGNLHTVRTKFFENLTEYDVKIWGNPSPFWLNSSKINHMVQHKYVSFDEKCKAFLGAKIVINNLHPTEINSLNARTFEVAATSAFQLVNYRDSAISLFEPDKEMVYFTDLKDMKEKVAFYLQHPEERLRIGNASMKRSVTDHTFTKRISTLLSIVFDNERNYPKVQRN